MLTTDMPDFINLMTGLCVIYGKSMNKALADIYWRALQRFDLPAIKDAFQAHVDNPDTGQFMPKPAEVVKYLEGSTSTQAMQAWTRVERAIGSVGSYRSVVFDDPLIHAVIADMGGWVQLCKTDVKELPFKANEFAKRYASFVLHAPQTYPRQLTGLLEQQNGQLGFKPEPPALIGDKQKALAVYQHGGDNTLLVHQPTLPLQRLIQEQPI